MAALASAGAKRPRDTKKLMLFDVDGTLTVARKKNTPEMAAFMARDRGAVLAEPLELVPKQKVRVVAQPRRLPLRAAPDHAAARDVPAASSAHSASTDAPPSPVSDGGQPRARYSGET